jgi:O-antigen ligase
MHDVNIDNSVGMRLSFARMGYYLFTLRPFSGYGDHNFKDRINDPFPSSFTTQYTRDFPVNAGFHNEFTTNMVRSGIWGFISTALLFFVPLGIFAYALKQSICNDIALFGLAFVICELISSISTEVFNLKFTATLYSFIIAILCGTVIKKIIQSRNHAPQ